MVLLDIISMIFRLAELVFAAIVAGVNGKYLHDVRGTSTWDQSRFIYTEVVAGLAILLSLLWLLPFASSFVHWGAEIIISICWFVAFGLIVNELHGGCGNVFDWGNLGIRSGDQCARFRAVMAFSFLSAICWLVSALIGIIWVRGHERRDYRRRTWRRS